MVVVIVIVGRLGSGLSSLGRGFARATGGWVTMAGGGGTGGAVTGGSSTGWLT